MTCNFTEEFNHENNEKNENTKKKKANKPMLFPVFFFVFSSFRVFVILFFVQIRWLDSGVPYQLTRSVAAPTPSR